MINLPSVTLVCVDTQNYGLAVYALKRTLSLINPYSSIFFTDIEYDCPEFSTVKIDRIECSQDYVKFITKKLHQHINTPHILLIRFDEFISNTSAWSNDFLEYDYVGGPFFSNFKTGGFSLRTRHLQEILAQDDIANSQFKEEVIYEKNQESATQRSRPVKIAPENVCNAFVKLLDKGDDYHYKIVRQPIILKRTAAMGDVIMLEPVMKWFHENGYSVILDTLPEFYELFTTHYYPIYRLNNAPQNLTNARIINFDMAYEVKPKQLILKSYYEIAGIKNGDLINSKLYFKLNHRPIKLFRKYVLVHIDTTPLTYKNVHGIDWKIIQKKLESLGYLVFQIGTNRDKIGTWMNTLDSKFILGFLIAGADLYIGIDSGPAHIAVACGIPSILFFGSVNPKFIYPNFDKIQIMQSSCDFSGCYHEFIGEIGLECRIDKRVPPCTLHTTEDLLKKIDLISAINVSD